MTALHEGDCLEVMRGLADGSAHCCVTSPPYFRLRDFGVAGQIGLEETPDAYVAKMVEVFREVRRILRSDGTCWLNLGDSYATNPGNGRGGEGSGLTKGGKTPHRSGIHKTDIGLKPKDLIGIPWRVAFALQADGWYLRSDIVWHKPNPMPESVRDRPTKSHEYLFLLSKSPTYYFDAEAVREPQSRSTIERFGNGGAPRKAGKAYDPGKHERLSRELLAGRNIGSVWTIATRPYKGAHFATFPPRLVVPCVKAGTSERGVCPHPECGKPWDRVVQRTSRPAQDQRFPKGGRKGMDASNGWGPTPRGNTEVTTLGWRPACSHDLDPVPAVVLDPFAGTGTACAVATWLGRDSVGIELNPRYIGLARRRIARVQPLLIRDATE